MFLPFASFITLVVPSAVLFGLAALPLDGVSGPPVVVTAVSDDTDGDIVFFAGGDAALPHGMALAGGPPTVFVLQSTGPTGASELPKVWLGVRITPVPAPLAAHLGTPGVMVANVYEGSPADQAGLEQYDVIVRLGAQEISEPAALTKAIAQAEPGQSVTLSVIRQAARREITLALAARPDKELGALVLKYTEPADEFDAAVKLYGKALELGPGGRWIMKDLGELYKMPDVLKELDLKLKGLDVKLDHLDFDWDAFDWPMMGRDLDIKILRKLREAESPDEPDEDARQVELRVRVSEDGRTITVQRDADGRFHVTHTDADGNESTTAYDDLEALQEADAEAYQLYHAHAGRGGRAMVHVRPFGHQALKLRKDFQVEVERRMKEAFEKARQAQGQAAEEYHKAMEKAQQAMTKSRVVVRTPGDGGPTARTESLLVFVGDDGVIKVTVSENGETNKFEFKSKAEFQAAEPELYERVREILE